MSVQSWQATSSGMAVAVYQPASAGCPGDDDPPPCSEKDFGDVELQAIMESLLVTPMLCVSARRWTVLRPRPRDAAEVACRQRK